MKTPIINYCDKFLNRISIFMNIGRITIWPYIVLKENYNSPSLHWRNRAKMDRIIITILSSNLRIQKTNKKLPRIKKQTSVNVSKATLNHLGLKIYLRFFCIKRTSDFDSLLRKNGPKKLYSSNKNQKIETYKADFNTVKPKKWYTKKVGIHPNEICPN